MDHDVPKEIEKALGENKTLATLTLSDVVDAYDNYVPLPKEFCRHLMIGIGLNTSLSEVDLNFEPINWDCPSVGRLAYVSHMLCDSVRSSV